MKPIYAFCTAATALSFAIAAAVSAASLQQSEPSGQGEVQATLQSTDAELGSYLDAPQTPGRWVYEAEPSETFALFGVDMENPMAIIRCDLRSKKIGIGRFGTSADSVVMRLTAETGSWVLHATQRRSSSPMAAAELNATDRTLDAIAITKGQFALMVEAMPTIYLPVSGEVGRVIEDCR